MNCSISVERHHNPGNINMKTLNNNKNHYKKESDLDIIVDQLCMKLQDIKDIEASTEIGMQRHSSEQTDAVRKYYAAFPALKKGQQSPLQYYLPPPAWCRKAGNDTNKVNMQCDLSSSKDWNTKKKFSSGKERRNSYHGQKKHNKKRCHSYSRSFESKENLPEWVTHEGVWDMETQDPVREFIRAIALDEGYGTCENTVTDELREINQISLKKKENMVPDWDDSLDLDTEWVIKEDLNPRVRTPMEEELYAKFEAKFDRSIEALWSRDQANTPDDEYQDLPIDFQDLLSSPSDQQFYDLTAEKSSLISLTESIWSNDAYDSVSVTVNKNVHSPNKSVDILHDRFKPLNLTDDVFVTEAKSPVHEVEPFSLYNYEGIYDVVPSVAEVLRSLTALNHNKNLSSFTEVLPRRHAGRVSEDVLGSAEARNAQTCSRRPETEREDLLTSSKTHFRPIRKEAETADPASAVRYADGATFDICGDSNPVKFQRSASGFLYLESEGDPKRYLEYRNAGSINYGRLNLTDAQREANSVLDDRYEFQLKFPLRQVEKAVQTEEAPPASAWGGCDECRRPSGAKKMRQSGMDSIWSEEGGGWRCGACAAREVREERAPPPADEELSREWEELLSDISAAHAQYTEPEPCGEERWFRSDRKRRHSVALRCARPDGLCEHPYAPFLFCCGPDRPLTR